MVIRLDKNWLLRVCKRCWWIWVCLDCRTQVSEFTQQVNNLRQSIKRRKAQTNNKQIDEKKLIVNQQTFYSAIQAFSDQQYDLAIKKFSEIQTTIDLSADKTSQDQVNLAFACASLANLYILTNNKLYQQKVNKALQIYQKYKQNYVEEIVAIKNNLAVAKSHQKSQEQSCVLLKQVLKMEDSYYSISDQRRLQSLNNLMCNYFEMGQREQAISTYKVCVQAMEKGGQKNRINHLIEQNYKYFTGLIQNVVQQVGNSTLGVNS